MELRLRLRRYPLEGSRTRGARSVVPGYWFQVAGSWFIGVEYWGGQGLEYWGGQGEAKFPVGT